MGDTTPTFRIDRSALEATGRVWRGEWTEGWLGQIEGFLNQIANQTGCAPVQRGRVVAVRQTDAQRLYSAFKSSIYHSRYESMLDGERFFRSLQPRRNSYEPFRGETIMFLFLYVGKNVYDGLSMFTYGRTARIIGGSRHSVPWGVEVPPQLEGKEEFAARNMAAMRRIAQLDAMGSSCSARESAELEALRCELPVCHCMAPFIMEFSEEALVTKVFKQRLWERGVERRDTAYVARDMWECCLALDPAKFQAFYDYQGPHAVIWEDGMRTLRDGETSVEEFIDSLRQIAEASEGGELSAYDAMMSYFDRARRR